jgi:hypothetical protein
MRGIAYELSANTGVEIRNPCFGNDLPDLLRGHRGNRISVNVKRFSTYVFGGCNKVSGNDLRRGGRNDR